MSNENVNTQRGLMQSAVDTYRDDKNETTLQGAISGSADYVRAMADAHDTPDRTSLFSDPNKMNSARRGEIKRRLGALRKETDWLLNLNILANIVSNPMDLFVDDKYVYAVNNSGKRLFVYDIKTLELLDNTPQLPGVGRSVVSDNTNVYIVSASNILVYNRQTWELVSESSPIPGTISKLKLDANRIYVAKAASVSPFEWSFAALDKHTLELVPGSDVILPGMATDVEVDNHRIYITHSGEPQLTILEKTTFIPVLFETPITTTIANGIGIDDDYLYIAHQHGRRFTVIDKETLSVKTDVPILTNTAYDVFVDTFYIYVAYFNIPRLAIYDRDTFELLQNTPELPGVASNVVATKDHIFVSFGAAPFITAIEKKFD